MKTPRFLASILTALLALLLTPRPAEARVEASFDFFYDSLSPYGEWVQVADYGYCWRPTDVDRDWAPYADGYWAYTDAGWTWVSYEDYGGIVYHYGRWVRVEDEGWCWVPDYEWGPAWVSWRNNDDYVGWAPLPPEARWRPSVGISIWADRVYDIGPAYYSFCRVRDFGAPVLRPVIINRVENVTIIRQTVNITNITYNTNYGDGPVIFNGGPNYKVINKYSSRHVPTLKLVQNVDINMKDLRDGDRRHNFNGRAAGNQLIVTAPTVKPPTDPDFLKSKTKKVFAADKVTRGWNGVKNDEVRKELKQEMQRQTRGLTPETAPAKAVAASDLTVVPEKADPDARPNEKMAREKEREQQKPAKGDTNLKPFNPVADTESKTRKEKMPAGTPESATEPRIAKPNEDAGKMRDAQRQAEAAQQREQEQIQARQQKALAEQEKAARKQAEAAAQQKQQMEAQRQAEGLRQQQKEEAAAASRQRMQGDQNRAARQQAEAAAAQQKQAEKQAEMLRRQQNQQSDEQARRIQEAQREQAKQSQKMEMQRQQQPREPQRSFAPPSATPSDSDKDRRGKKKDKDN
jgi:hypothetical protein